MHASLLCVLGKGLDMDGRDLLVHWLESHAPAPLDRAAAALARIRSANPLQPVEQLESPIYAQMPVWDELAVAAMHLARDLPALAVPHLEQVKRTRPDNTAVLHVLGQCYERIGQADKAIECYQDCLKIHADLEQPLQRLAAIALSKGQIEHAIEYYAAMVAAHPTSIEPFLLLGQMYMGVGQHQQASKIIEDGILLNPGALAWHDPDLELLIQQGEYDKALERLQLQTTAGANTAEILAKKAQILSNMEEPEQALEAYQSAVQACPTYLEALVQLAGMYSRSDMSEQASLTYLKALEANEMYVEAYTCLAKSYNLEGRSEQAAEHIQSAAELIPNSIYLLAQAFRSMIASDRHTQPTLQQAISILHSLSTKHSSDDPCMACYISTLLAWPNARPQNGPAMQDTPGDYDQEGLDICWPLRTIIQISSGDTSALSERISMPNRDLTSALYKTSVLYTSSLRMAGSILNVAASLGNWPTWQVLACLASAGVIPRAQMYGLWLESLLRSHAEE